jgi:hypothetical protein
MLCVMAVGDALVFQWRPAWAPREVWALLDSPVHGALALLAVSPLWMREGSAVRRLDRAASAVVAAVFVDLDHFVAAGSFSVLQATSLGERPAAHSLLFAVGCGLLAWSLRRDPIDGWLISGVLASHILRDASTGSTPLLWPLAFDQLSQPVYYAAQIGVWAISHTATLVWSKDQGDVDMAENKPC